MLHLPTITQDSLDAISLISSDSFINNSSELVINPFECSSIDFCSFFSINSFVYPVSKDNCSIKSLS